MSGQVSMDALQPYIHQRHEIEGMKIVTVNHSPENGRPILRFTRDEQMPNERNSALEWRRV